MTTEYSLKNKKLCIALLVLMSANLSGLLHAQFVKIDIDLPPRFEMRIISPKELQDDHPGVAKKRTALVDDSLLPEELLWLEISSIENLELLIDTRGEHHLYYINRGGFDPEQAVPFTGSTTFRLSWYGRPDVTSKLFKAWIGIWPREKGLISINYN